MLVKPLEQADQEMTLPFTPQRILIIRPSALGDVCRSVCVLASLRRAWPDAKIDWVVQEEFAAAIETHPALNEVIAFPRSRLAQWWKSPARLHDAIGWLRGLHRSGYDLVLDAQGLGRSGLMCLATRAKVRVGLRRARELAWLGYTQRVPQNPDESKPVHTVDQMMLLVEHLGIDPQRDMRLYLHDQHYQWWQEQRLNLGLADAPYAVIAPTSRWPSKRWPIDRFAQLLQPLAQRGFAAAVVIGAPGELDQVHALTASPSPFCIDLVGKISIAQMMAVIAGAGVVIANDSAPLHMAVGFDRPCVGLFGPTNPAEVGPYRRDDAVVRGYHAGEGEKINFKNPKLGDSLMRFISTASVVQAIDRQLAQRADSASRAVSASEHDNGKTIDRATPRAAARIDS